MFPAILPAMAGSVVVALFLTFVFISVRKSVKMAFSDPYDKNYMRKTDKELRNFLIQSCFTAFLFAVISYKIFIYIAILYWFYFIIFMLKFSTVWQFHGKKRLNLFLIILATMIVSFVAAPFVRGSILELLNHFGIY